MKEPTIVTQKRKYKIGGGGSVCMENRGGGEKDLLF